MDNLNKILTDYAAIGGQIKALQSQQKALKNQILEAHGLTVDGEVKTLLLESEDATSKISYRNNKSLNLEKVKTVYNIDLDLSSNPDAVAVYDASQSLVLTVKAIKKKTLVEG